MEMGFFDCRKIRVSKIQKSVIICLLRWPYIIYTLMHFFYSITVDLQVMPPVMSIIVDSQVMLLVTFITVDW